MKRLSLIVCLVCASCSTQYTETPSGQKVVNNNLLSSGMLQIWADGSIVMAGNAEKAAEMLKESVRLRLNAGLIQSGIDATKSIGNNTIDAISDSQ